MYEYKAVMTNENVSLLVKNDLQTIDTCFDLIRQGSTLEKSSTSFRFFCVNDVQLVGSKIMSGGFRWSSLYKIAIRSFTGACIVNFEYSLFVKYKIIS